MTITASMVKELRDKTGAGMLDAKKALTENDGDMEKAVDWLRTKGIAKAAKKAGRVAADGMVLAVSSGTKGAVVEVNAETDFVAKNETFKEFVQKLADVVLQSGTTDMDALANENWPEGGTVGEKVTDLVATIGENIGIRRAATLEVSSGAVAAYVHMGGKIGVLTAVEASEANDTLTETARQVAMHVAASNPQALDRDSIEPAVVEREKSVLTEKAKESGKPEAIIEKMLIGQMNKFYEESCLTEQAFIMDTDRKVADVVSGAVSGAKVIAFTRFALGEGIEKQEDNLAEEVAKMRASA